MQMYEEITKALTGRATCRITHTLRTIEEQDALYAQGRTKPGKKVTNAKGGQSYHNFGMAFDICLIVDGKTASWDMEEDFDKDHEADWMEVVRIAKKYGWEWGGDFVKFRDNPHFQKTYGYATTKLKAMVKGSGYPAPL
jgi:peptidoglycan L-alanyl-D-glutamate endopeptidase CwlK